MLPAFALIRPDSVQSAVAELGDEAIPYCGGTELLLAMRSGLLFPKVLVDLKAIPELTGVETDGGQLLIGATVSHAQLVRHPLIARHAPFLADVERQVGNPRVRAQGSVGGNLCFGEPRSDLLTALIALRASVLLQGRDQPREVAVADFLQAPYTPDRRDDELLVHIAVPLPLPPVAVYRKYQITERPTVAVAMAGDDSAARIVVGAAGELPVYRDGPPAGVDVGELAAALDPVADVSGSEEYKRSMAEVYVRRAMADFQAKAVSA